MNVCKPKAFISTGTINLLLQISLLFTFLSIFFMTIGSKIIQSSFQSLLKSNINNVINRATIKQLIINSITLPNANNILPQSLINDYIASKSGDVIDQFLDSIVGSSYYKRILQYYSTDVDNSVVMNRIFIVNCFLWSMVILIMITTKTSCLDVSIAPLIGINIAIIVFLGIIEATFFYFVASKYVGTPPSTTAMALVNEIKSQINS